VVTYTTLIKAFGAKGDYDKTLSFLEEMKNINITPSLVSYNTLIKLFGVKGDYDKVLSFFEEMKKKQHQTRCGHLHYSHKHIWYKRRL